MFLVGRRRLKTLINNQFVNLNHPRVNTAVYSIILNHYWRKHGIEKLPFFRTSLRFSNKDYFLRIGREKIVYYDAHFNSRTMDIESLIPIFGYLETIKALTEQGIFDKFVL